jgi:hypothetical protein
MDGIKLVVIISSDTVHLRKNKYSGGEVLLEAAFLPTGK